MKPSKQAVAAMKIKELYLWWTETRPNRPDPWIASGYAALVKLEDADDIFGAFVGANKNEKSAASKRMWEMEGQYEQEDQEKLIELISIRKSLWT